MGEFVKKRIFSSHALHKSSFGGRVDRKIAIIVKAIRTYGMNRARALRELPKFAVC